MAMVIDVGALRVLAQAPGQQIERQVVAAEDDEQAALTLVRHDHEVDRVRARRGAVELLDVALGGPGLHELDQAGLLETQDVVPHPGGMMPDDGAELRERRRAAHEQAQQAKALLVREHAHGVHRPDMADLFHRPSPSTVTADVTLSPHLRVD